MYEILKDFAGPVATIIASVTAALITWYFASRQAQIATQQADISKQQADTALDQLRHNLFERRYQIYNTAKDLIKYLVNELSRGDEHPLMQAVQYYAKLEEARFFFPDDICEWLKLLRRECDKYMHLRATGASEEIWWAQSYRLSELFGEMPSRFEKALQFPRLTGRQ
jgi:hypothetical protein